MSCNFLTVDFTPLNGPIRQIPFTQHSREPMPLLAVEPEWMKLSTGCPAPAGSVQLLNRHHLGSDKTLRRSVRSTDVKHVAGRCVVVSSKAPHRIKCFEINACSVENRVVDMDANDFAEYDGVGNRRLA